LKHYTPWKAPHAGTRKENEEEAAVEKKCYELTTTPIPLPSVPLRGKELKESGVKLRLGRKRGGAKAFQFCF